MAASRLTSDDVPFSPPDVGDAEIAEVVAVLQSGWLSTGSRVQSFEQAFARRLGATHAVAVNSCTAGLHLSLLAAGVGPGHDVVTTPLTFCATANCIVHTGARPVFADIEPASCNLDPDAAAAAVTSRTRAIVPVHFAGRPADVIAIGELARRRGLAMIEDAAHCVAGAIGGRQVGTIGDCTCFSFYATKNLTTAEGGMVTTESGERAEWIRIAALHGMSRGAWSRYQQGGSADYDVSIVGFKYNMTDLQAAIGLVQLLRLDEMQARRAALWRLYDEGLSDLPLGRPSPPDPQTTHARHLYTVLVDPARVGLTRDLLRERLRERGVMTGLHFHAVHLFSYYAQRFGYRRGTYPHAERVSDQILSLPFSSALTDQQVLRVVETIHDVLADPN